MMRYLVHVLKFNSIAKETLNWKYLEKWALSKILSTIDWSINAIKYQKKSEADNFN